MSDLYRQLIEYSNSDYYPFHMPGHKRMVQKNENPYSYDITEIEGFDNLHNPQGILRIAMDEAKKFYESDKTYFLVNGSTCGLLTAISAVTKKGDKIIVARNCHKAVYNAIYLNELLPVYVHPEYIREYGINGGITPVNIANVLESNQDAVAVVITSPTYEGVVSDIEKIAKEVHERGKILIVDEAHGAHFGMHGNLPKSALALGADIVIQSVHKTLPALTQCAIMHIKGERVNKGEVERFLSIYQTSSPSYVLIASIIDCIERIKSEGIFLFEPYVKRMMVIANHAKSLTHIKIMGKEIIDKNGVYDFDIGKLVISVRGTGYTGSWLQEQLLERFHLQMEMASADYVIAMTSIMDTEEGLLRLFKALTEIDRDIRIEGYNDIKNNDGSVTKAYNDYVQEKAVVIEKLYDAVNSEKELLKLRDSVGKISSEFVYLYPPGCPIIAPGELISLENVELINRYKESGLIIQGCEYKNAEKIFVVKEEFKRINLVKGKFRLA